jgi:ParB family chromosome partitioning protein
MASTRNILEQVASNLDESMGVRSVELQPTLSPVAKSKDIGRRPVRHIGKIDINQVIPDPDQPRAAFSEEAILRLAESIKEQGQFQPIMVRWNEELGKWVIIAGERRWRATKQAGLPTIDCFFKEGDFSKAEILSQQLIENMLREDLQPIEQAKAFATLLELNDWSGKQLAASLHLEPSTVSRSLALLKLPEAIQQQVELGELAPRSAYEISKLEDDDSKVQLANKATAEKLTRDDTIKIVRQRKPGLARKKKPSTTSATFISEAGWKVVVTGNKRGSYHEIAEALQDALDEVEHRIENGVKLY